jgi:hypothetical protein
MGQAKNRGTREQRVSMAAPKTDRFHAFINELRSESLYYLEQFPCADCGNKISPEIGVNETVQTPVPHVLQWGICNACDSAHFVASARTKADCIQLEPIFEEMKAKIPNMFRNLSA